MPKLSVITVNYNNFDGLAATMNSLMRQDFRDYEIVLIDGKSTDESVHVLDGYTGRAACIVSEADNGPYDAMNKGLEKATGNWVVFMNSGDCFHDSQTLSSVFNRNLSNLDMVYGRTVDRRTRRTLPYKPIDQIHTGNAFCHQSVFYRRDVHKRFPYDTDFKISADYKATVSMLAAGARLGRLDRAISTIDVDGISAAVPNRHAERDKVIRDVLGGAPVDIDLVELS